MFESLIVKLHRLIGLPENFRRQKVELSKQKFFESLKNVEANPTNQAILSKSQNLGVEYRWLSAALGVENKNPANESNIILDTIKDVSIAKYRGLLEINGGKTTVETDELNTDEIMVVISGNWMDAPITLTEWIKSGPGMRFLRHPFRAWSLRTGEELPLEAIPIQYRNNDESRKKIENGEVPNPWDFETDY